MIQFAQDPRTAAAMNPKTGEVLALVSTPGYDQMNLCWGCRMQDGMR